jgi:hypothetical protein
MPIFVDIKKKPREDQPDTGLPDIAKYIYAAVNDGDSPLTAQRKQQEDEADEAFYAQESKNNDKSEAGNTTSQKPSEK